MLGVVVAVLLPAVLQLVVFLSVLVFLSAVAVALVLAVVLVLAVLVETSLSTVCWRWLTSWPHPSRAAKNS